MPRLIGLIPAAGVGARFGAHAGHPKQYAPLLGEPMLVHALRALLAHASLERVYVVLAPADNVWPSLNLDAMQTKVQALFCGGETRAESVANALEQMAPAVKPNDWVLVHDAARPCLRLDVLTRLIDELKDDETGGLLAVPLTDTLKRADGWQRVESTEPRERLWRAQTPQMFRFGVLQRALAAAPVGVATDESWAVEKLGLRPRLVQGEAANLKVTFAEDIAIAEQFLRAWRSAPTQNSQQQQERG